MLAKVLDHEELKRYDNLTDEALDAILAEPEDLSSNLQPQEPSLNLNYHLNEKIFRPDKQVMIRILWPAAYYKRKSQVGINKPTPTDILIHIHGGAFMSMSSASHQNVTRFLANKLGIPVFSVDYRLTPEAPYPAAVNDCY